ncbi:MAG: hypothetical protein AUH19_00695 [Verrucomicrobia bacterium 13_2_20CM_55_10]|nr:MAG: hypothetical protein AUH19_00695 [Verrucomicrobia bacterium 13_2_20CM_55_10]
MPDGSSDDASERHRQHEFPGEIHDLIDARPGQRPAEPDVNEQQCAEFREKPDVGGNKFKRADGCVPATEKQRRSQPSDGKHSNVFRHEERGVFETGIFGHVSGHNFRFAFRHIERSAVRFHQSGHKKQNERGRAPRRKDEPPRHKAERVAALRRDNRLGYE